MSSDEIFVNPTVKQVIFEARFSNLFFLEGKIGEIQMVLMEKFPKTQLLYTQQILLGNLAPEQKLKEEDKPTQAEKIWRFQDDAAQITVDIQTSRFSVSSILHKTYNHPGSEQKFRDVLQLVVNAFIKVTSLPRFARIGLRYVNECPLAKKDPAVFAEYYNSFFPAARFSIADTQAFEFTATVVKDAVSLRSREFLAGSKDSPTYVLDYDGFAQDVIAKDWLKITDTLHEVTTGEYFKTIKEPVKVYMRKPKEA